jgi:hypothetical protein
MRMEGSAGRLAGVRIVRGGRGGGKGADVGVTDLLALLPELD